MICGGAQTGAVADQTHRYTDLDLLRDRDLQLEALGAMQHTTYEYQILDSVAVHNNICVYSSIYCLPDLSGARCTTGSSIIIIIYT